MKRGREGPQEDDDIDSCATDGDGGGETTTISGSTTRKGVTRRPISCVKCRQRKVKCEPVTPNGPAYPCARCTRMKLECTDPRTVEAEMDEVSTRSQHLLKLMNKGIDNTTDEDRTRALIIFFTLIYRRWILMGKAPMNGVVATHMRSLLKPLLAKEGLDLERYLSKLTPLQGPATVTIDGQFLSHEGGWGSQLLPYVGALYHEAYSTIGLVVVNGSDRFVVNKAFADHFYTAEEAEHVNSTQDVLRPTIMAAVLAPEERPRFEKTLQDMTVSLTSSCELTSVYKVRLLKLGVSVMAVIRYRLLFLEQGQYYAFVMALSPLPMHASAPKRGPQGDRRAVLQCCLDADPWIECAKTFGEWDARPSSSSTSSEESDSTRAPAFPVMQESGMHSLLESLQRLPPSLSGRPDSLPPSPPTPTLLYPRHSLPPPSSTAPPVACVTALEGPWPSTCPPPLSTPLPPSPPEPPRRYPGVSRPEGRPPERAQAGGESTHARRGPSVLGERRPGDPEPPLGLGGYDAVGVRGYDATGRREYCAITREPRAYTVPPEHPPSARTYASAQRAVAPSASSAAAPPPFPLFQPQSSLSALQQQLLNLPPRPFQASLPAFPPPSLLQLRCPLPQLPVGVGPSLSPDELMQVFANDGLDSSGHGGNNFHRVKGERPDSATCAGTQPYTCQDTEQSMGVDQDKAPMRISPCVPAEQTQYPEAQPLSKQGW